MASALAPAVATKLAKLLPMLSSDNDGEVVATVRVIDRTLQSSGVDFHILAKLVTEPKTVVVWAGPEWDEEPVPQSWRDLARWCRDHDGGRLSTAERKFVTDMALRLVLSGKPTVKQAAWLRAIYARLQEDRP
jgi:hypothetical protein